MKFRCPKCQAEVDATQTVCPACGASVSVGSLLSIYLAKGSTALASVFRGIWGGGDKGYTAACSGCGKPVPFSAAECPHCKLPIRLSFLYTWYGKPIYNFVRWVHNFAEEATPGQKKMARFGYFIASGTLLWLVLIKAETKFEGHAGGWIVAALATVFYVAVSLLLLPWFLPRGTIRVLGRIRPIMKLSLFVNYITLVLGVMMASDVWKVRSWLLITTFIASFIGFNIFMNYVHPTWVMLGQILESESELEDEDPNYRGRSAERRTGKWS